MTTHPKILIIDDEPDICYFLSRNLSKKNYEVSYVHSLEDAEMQIRQGFPSLVILDNHLPDGFGINYITRIKSHSPEIKVIMISAHDSPQDRAKARSNGADFFLSKPFSLPEVNSTIDHLLDSKEE